MTDVTIKTRRVNILLGIAILFLPWLFCWILLRKGYSKKSRLIAFSWLAFIAFAASLPDTDNKNNADLTKIEKPLNLETIKQEQQKIIDQKKQQSTEQKPEKIDKEAIRANLLLSYKTTIQDANPHLNFIKSKYTKSKKGYSLWAVHSFFTQHSLSIGPDAKVIMNWIEDHETELKQAKIIKVGLKNEDGLLGEAWFDIK